MANEVDPVQPIPAEAYYDIWEEIKAASQAFYPTEPTYWDEKAKDRREEFLREDAENRERAYPERKP